MSDFTVGLCALEVLRPHEQTIQERVRDLRRAILQDGIIKTPILIDRSTGVILDGHHRHRALQGIGFKVGPVLAADYTRSSITLKNDKNGPPGSPTKVDVIERAQSGELFPPKSTRHRYPSVQWRVTTHELFVAGLGRA